MKLRINEIRKQKQVDWDVLAERVGLSESHLIKIAHGHKNPNTLRLQQIADALNCKVIDFFESPEGMGDITEAPYRGDVNGGNPLVIEDRMIDGVDDAIMIKTPGYVKDGYVLRVIGSSVNEDIPNGSYVLIDPHVPDHATINGHYVIIRKDSECTCKRYNHILKRGEPATTVAPHDYEAVDLTAYDTEIIGVVVQSFKNWGL